MDQIEVLRRSDFGKRTAEEERQRLSQYFVKTEQWKRVYSGDVDVVYGPKGSGKSALYSLILENEDDLFDKRIIVTSAENPQGAAVFQNLRDDAPVDEFEFISLWKLYIVSICAGLIKQYGISGHDADRVVDVLEKADLIPSDFSLSKILRYAFDYVKSIGRISDIEGSIQIDHATGMPTGFGGRISLREPSAVQARLGIVSIDELFRLSNRALCDSGYNLWILFDRLDVAFSDRSDLEANALRALFRTYLDIKEYNSICLKIFLRSDIWHAVVKEGFREASHIERSLTIEWRADDLINLVVQRVLSNDQICRYYGVDRDGLLEDFESQKSFLEKVFPRQVDSGPNKPTSFNWIISRTRDATGVSAPREIIHFLNELRDVQIGRLERGVPPPDDMSLFEQIAFKEALPAVSKVRLEQTLYAEYPHQKNFIESLREQKATQTVASLCAAWAVSREAAIKKAAELEEIGFLQRSGTAPNFLWSIPFLYRPALSLVQGSA